VANRASLGLAIVVMVVSGLGICSALAWPLKAKLFPLVIGIPLFCLALAEALRVLLAKDHEEEFRLSPDQPNDVALRRTLIAAGWAIGFFVAIVLLGFQVAVPVLVLAYIRLQGKESWLFTIVFTAGVWAVFYGLFDRLLHLPFPAGLLFGGWSG
jgi:hypothetical protein